MSNFFARQAVSHQRRLAKCCKSLYGICAGILADNAITADEVRFLQIWLKENDEIAYTWPGEVIAKRVQAVLEDGQVTAEELDHLRSVLSDLVGGTLEETGAVGQSTKLPIDDSVDVIFPGRSFCVTGDFLYGTRSKVLGVISDRGGIVAPGVRMDLGYLVIGYMSAREWKYETFGTKIAKAVEYQDRGKPIAIISEARWTAALTE